MGILPTIGTIGSNNLRYFPWPVDSAERTQRLRQPHSFTWQEQKPSRFITLSLGTLTKIRTSSGNDINSTPEINKVGESIDQYVTDLKTKAQTCEFGTFNS